MLCGYHFPYTKVYKNGSLQKGKGLGAQDMKA